MGIGDWFKGKARSTQPTSAVRRPDELITVYDERGRELKIKRRDWVQSVLGPQIEKVWNDPEGLYTQIVQGLRDDLVEQVASAAEHLVELDAESERALILAGIVRMEGGDLAGAERALTRSIELRGETGIVATNLSKVYDRRGEKDRSLATLRRSLELDPNQDNGLLWWAALAKEQRGQVGFIAALEGIAGLPGAWRPHLWLARNKLEQGDCAGAITLYEHALSLAADQPDVLMMVTGDLGKAGALEDLVRLAAHRYKPETHGPPAGMNIAHALKDLGRTEEARGMVRRLQAMGWAPMAAALAEMDSQIAASALPRRDDSVPAIAATAFDAPLWTRGLFDPTWLLPARADDVPYLVLFTLANEMLAGTPAQVQRSDKDGGLTRAIPLYLAETLQLKFLLRVRCSILVAKGQGPVVLGKALQYEALARLLPEKTAARCFVVTGSLVPEGIQLQVHEAGANGPASTVRIDGPLTDVGALALSAEQCLTSFLAERRVLSEVRPPAFYRPPAADIVAGYLSALEQLLYQILAANDMVAPESLWNERGMFETYFNLVETWKNAPDSARLIAVCGVLAGAKYKSSLLEPYQKIVLRWVDEAPPSSVLGQLAPAIFQRLGRGEKLEQWLQGSRHLNDANYATWVERVRSGV